MASEEEAGSDDDEQASRAATSVYHAKASTRRPRAAPNMRTMFPSGLGKGADNPLHYYRVASIKSEPDAPDWSRHQARSLWTVFHNTYLRDPWTLGAMVKFSDPAEGLGDDTFMKTTKTMLDEHMLALRLQSYNAIDYKTGRKPDTFVNVTTCTDYDVLLQHFRDMVQYYWEVRVAKILRRVHASAVEEDPPTYNGVELVSSRRRQLAAIFKAMRTQKHHGESFDWMRLPQLALSGERIVEYVYHEIHTKDVDAAIAREGYTDAGSARHPKRLLYRAPAKLPYRVCAPPRQGKSAIALNLMSIGIKLGAYVFVGVAPNKNVPISEWYNKWESLQWNQPTADTQRASAEVTIEFKTSRPGKIALALWSSLHPRSDPPTPIDVHGVATDLQHFKKSFNAFKTADDPTEYVFSDVSEVNTGLAQVEYPGSSDAGWPKETLDQFASVVASDESGTYAVRVAFTVQLEATFSSVTPVDAAKLGERFSRFVTALAGVPCSASVVSMRTLSMNSLGGNVGHIGAGGRIVLSHMGSTHSVADCFGTPSSEPTDPDRRVHVLYYSTDVNHDVENVAKIMDTLNRRETAVVFNIIDEVQTICKNDVLKKSQVGDKKENDNDRAPRGHTYGKHLRANDPEDRSPPPVISQIRTMFGTPLRGQLALVSATQLPAMLERSLWGALPEDGPVRCRYVLDAETRQYKPKMLPARPGMAPQPDLARLTQPDPGSSPFHNYNGGSLPPEAELAANSRPWTTLPDGKGSALSRFLPALQPKDIGSYYGPCLLLTAPDDGRMRQSPVHGLNIDGTNPMCYFTTYTDRFGRPVLLPAGAWTTDADAVASAAKGSNAVQVSDLFMIPTPPIELRATVQQALDWLDRRDMPLRGPLPAVGVAAGAGAGPDAMDLVTPGPPSLAGAADNESDDLYVPFQAIENDKVVVQMQKANVTKPKVHMAQDAVNATIGYGHDPPRHNDRFFRVPLHLHMDRQPTTPADQDPVAIPMHIVATSRKGRYENGFLERARFLAQGAAHRMMRDSWEEPKPSKRRLPTDRSTDMATLRLHYGVAFVLFSSAEIDQQNYTSGADIQLGKQGFKKDHKYHDELQEEVVTSAGEARCFLAVFDPAVPVNRPPGITRNHVDPRSAQYGLQRTWSKGNGKLVEEDVAVDTAEHDGLLAYSPTLLGDDQRLRTIAPQPTADNIKKQVKSTVAETKMVREFPELNHYHKVRLIGYSVKSVQSAVKIAMRIHGVVNVCVLGYNMMSAGLTLQTTLLNDRVYRDTLREADDPDGRGSTKAMKVCFVPKSAAVFSSEDATIDEQYQLYGRACVDMRGERLPEIDRVGSSVPWTWKVEILGSSAVVKAFRDDSLREQGGPVFDGNVHTFEATLYVRTDRFDEDYLDTDPATERTPRQLPRPLSPALRDRMEREMVEAWRETLRTYAPGTEQPVDDVPAAWRAHREWVERTSAEVSVQIGDVVRRKDPQTAIGYDYLEISVQIVKTDTLGKNRLKAFANAWPLIKPQLRVAELAGCVSAAQARGHWAFNRGNQALTFYSKPSSSTAMCFHDVDPLDPTGQRQLHTHYEGKGTNVPMLRVLEDYCRAELTFATLPAPPSQREARLGDAFYTQTDLESAMHCVRTTCFPDETNDLNGLFAQLLSTDQDRKLRATKELKTIKDQMGFSFQKFSFQHKAALLRERAYALSRCIGRRKMPLKRPPTEEERLGLKQGQLWRLFTTYREWREIEGRFFR